MLFCATSCSTSEPPPIDGKEQTNLKFEQNNATLFEDIQVESGIKDLIEFEFNKNLSDQLRFSINLENGDVLQVNLYQKDNDKLWESTTNFPVYPSEVIESRFKYCSLNYITSESNYASNLTGLRPLTPDIDAFEIVSYNPINKEMSCKFNATKLYNSADAEIEITLSGTFIGIIDFIE